MRLSLVSIAWTQWKRLRVSAFPWVLTALSVVFLAWTFLHALSQFAQAQSKLAALPAAPGFTDLVAVPLLGQLGMLALLLAPLLGMSVLASDRRHGTLSTLFAAGVSPRNIVLGKFIAVYGWALLLLLLTVAMPLSLLGATDLDGGKLAAATLGVGLMFGALLAVALACSAFTSHPALAAAAAVLISLVLWSLNMGARAEGMHTGVLNYLALPNHLHPLLRGLVRSEDLAYFVLLTAFALTLAILRVGADKVRG